MSRVRWYHFYFCLAAFDVIVILFSLHLHDRTLEGVSRLITSFMQLDEQSRWLQLAQQRFLELNAPGNELFRVSTAQAYQEQRQRFRQAGANIRATLDAARSLGLDVAPLNPRVEEIQRAAEKIFAAFEPATPGEGLAGGERRSAVLTAASPAMAEMDAAQCESLRALGLLFAQNASERVRLLQRHEADLEDRVSYVRYFVAAVVVMLAGALAFGRRLHQADRALQEHRRRADAEHQERLAAIGELCSSVAHGIRNPLAAIRSSAQLSLELGRLDPQSRERIRDIVAEGERLGDRVNGLLDIARLDRDGFEPVDLRAIVAAAARELKPEMDKLGLKIEQVNAGDPVVLKGDARHLEQVVIELLSNAMHYSCRGDNIVIGCIEPDARGDARIIVQDQGPGVPVQARPRIFDLFFTTNPEGTGIGLATVKRVARLHGGDVVLESPDSGGARFVVSLPVGGADGGGAGLGADSEHPAAGRRMAAFESAWVPEAHSGRPDCLGS